ncbi:glycosyltransferase family 4 protein [Ferrimonas marina]|uniref:Glycosyltransferase subfamily 4-like N-terminal domain-containing protein n=1 Tax=Ferrimonas marina TaxID=299255 RepID=A0A1M5RSP4_9GAMM|nr:glycosyltransferase family 4 protein [Ferrimonas marina]SHH29169.1 hypothetical protein SAMN02745129_1732 [Ferrimonas marina]
MGTHWLLLDSRGFGGIESYVLNLASGLHRRGHPVEVVLYRQYDEVHPLADKLTSAGIPMRILQGTPWDLWRQLRRQRPRLVHTHGYKAGILARLLGHLARVPVISSFHAADVTDGRMLWYDRLDRFTAALARDTLAVSRPIAARLGPCCRVINNFVPLPAGPSQLSTLATPAQEVALVGRVCPVKGIERFLRLAQAQPAQRFALYGDGPQLDEVRAQIRALGPTNLHCYGQVTDMADHWHKVGLLCIPSYQEGLPMVALEAMARGIPVLATPVGELPRLIQPGRNGWLLEGDALGQWVACLTRWRCMTPAARRTIQAQARARIVSDYSDSAVLPQWELIYRLTDKGLSAT